MGKGYLLKLNPGKFGELAKMRAENAGKASATLTDDDFCANKLAKALHPAVQHVIVTKVTEEKDGMTKHFFLMPDIKAGTRELAYFTAGQLLTVFVNINGIITSRPYSISSSPKDASLGFYRISVKRVEGGIVSNYILDNWKPGMKVDVSGPKGIMYYVRLRDSKNIVALAGGSGITPFVSMAKSIVQGTEDAETMTILYGSRTESSIILKDELEAIEKESDGRIKIINVLSHEDNSNYETGYITADMIKKYAPEDYTLFVSGPAAMFRHLVPEIEKLHLEQKYIRLELMGEAYSPKVYSDYPGCEKDTVKLTVRQRGETHIINAPCDTTILRTLEKEGIVIPSSCRSGRCGACRAHLDSGKVYIPESSEGRRFADAKFGFIHTCASFPLSDVEISV